MFSKLEAAMGRLQDRLDAMPDRALIRLYVIGIAGLLVLGLVSSLIH